MPRLLRKLCTYPFKDFSANYGLSANATSGDKIIDRRYLILSFRLIRIRVAAVHLELDVINKKREQFVMYLDDRSRFFGKLKRKN